MAATLLAFSFLFIIVCFFLQIHRKKPGTSNNLPPGSFGWPFLGETLEFIGSRRAGTPEKFVRDRRERYGSPLVFKTSLFGHRMAIFCGSEGNKFLFGNENKLVASWWPESITTLFGKCINTCRGDEAKWLRKMMLPYLGPDALSNRYSVTMDVVTRLHIQNHWEGIIWLKYG
ncbi:putative protopanaxadiol 6-hydroxylase [Helianthus debilis subsp. tardiflorus]